MVNVDAVLKEITSIEAELETAKSHEFKEAHERLRLLCKELCKTKSEYKHIDCNYPESLSIRVQFVGMDHEVSDEKIIENSFLEQRQKLLVDDLGVLKKLKLTYELKKRLDT